MTRRVRSDLMTFRPLSALCRAGRALRLLLLRPCSRDGLRAARAELRLRRTRERLRAARAELLEADEYLAAQGELLDRYEGQFGPLPFDPFASGGPGGDDGRPRESAGVWPWRG
jgi:hypothetical protein